MGAEHEGHGHHEHHDPEVPAEPQLARTDTYGIAVTIDAQGTQVNALVFRKPVQGDEFARGDLWAFNPETGLVGSISNDAGVIPHRERTSDDEDLGLTWQFKK